MIAILMYKMKWQGSSGALVSFRNFSPFCTVEQRANSEGNCEAVLNPNLHLLPIT